MFPALSPLQRFRPETIHRSEIKNAGYNPRTITLEQREKLQDSLKEFGLVNSLVWNSRTGNLVGGHQRIEIIDGLSATGADYSLTVDAVDIDEDREKALNIILNARPAQGDFDENILAALLAELEGKLEFDLAAIFRDAEAERKKLLADVAGEPEKKPAGGAIGRLQDLFSTVKPEEADPARYAMLARTLEFLAGREAFQSFRLYLQGIG